MTTPSKRWTSLCAACSREAEIESRPTHGMRALCDACAARPHKLPTATALNAPRVSSNGRQTATPAATGTKPTSILQPRGIDLSRVQPFKWAWRDRILKGYLNLLVGDEGVGKGTFLAWLIARWTRGDLEGDMLGKPARVLVVGDEDGFDGVWVPRLHAAGADLSMVFDLPVDEMGALNIARDAKKLHAMLLQNGFDVVIFDQLLDNLGSDVDDWRSKSVRDAIAPLRRITAELNITTLAALHTNKSDAATFRRRLSGTQAFNAISRSSLLLAEHPNDPARRVVVRGKGNYAAPPEAFEFHITSEPLQLNGHTHKPSMATDVKPSDVTIDDVLRASIPEPQTKAHAARTLIAETLEDGDWHDAAPIRAQLAESGHSERGIVRAANDLGIERRRTSGFQSGHDWRLARGGGLTGTTGTTGTNGKRSDASDASRASGAVPTSLAAMGSTDDPVLPVTVAWKRAREHYLVDEIARAFNATEIDKVPENAIHWDMALAAAVADDVLDTNSRREAAS